MPVEDVLVVDSVTVAVATVVAVLTLVDTCAVDSGAPEYRTRQYIKEASDIAPDYT